MVSYAGNWLIDHVHLSEHGRLTCGNGRWTCSYGRWTSSYGRWTCSYGTTLPEKMENDLKKWLLWHILLLNYFKIKHKQEKN